MHSSAILHFKIMSNSNEYIYFFCVSDIFIAFANYFDKIRFKCYIRENTFVYTALFTVQWSYSLHYICKNGLLPGVGY